MADLQDNQVKISGNRIVTMKENTAADEAVIAMALGDKVSLQGAGAIVLGQANAIKAIADIDGKPLQKEDGTANYLRNYNDFLAAFRLFKSRDMSKLMEKYSDLNSEGDESDPLE